MEGAAGEAIPLFSPEQGRGDAGCRETAQHTEHSRCGSERIRIDDSAIARIIASDPTRVSDCSGRKTCHSAFGEL